MSQPGKQYKLLPGCKPFLLAVALLCSCFVFGQDDCSAANNVTLAGGGFGTGLVTSSVINITPATVQPGENFSPANSAAGQTGKTIWYKFNLPTNRSVTIRLDQNTASIAPGDVGFAVYKTSSCLPGNADLSTQFSPVTVFGTTSSICLEPGDYLVQVAAKSSANGSVYIQIQTGLPATSPYDFASQAYDFRSLATGVASVNYRVECQSVDNASEVCNSLPNSTQYTKTTWHVFTTPTYFDYISLLLANQSLPPGQTYGFNIYKGNFQSSTGILVSGCNSFTSNAYKSAQETFTCSDLNPNTTYSIQIFYHQNFTDNVQLSLVTAGTVPTALPRPLLSSLIGNNRIALTPTTAGNFANPQDYFGCNSRHVVTACPPSLPSTSINYKGRNFNLSSFFSLDLSSAATVSLGATPTCGPALLIRLFRQSLTNNCSDLDEANLVAEGIGSATLPSCVAAGKYVVQVSGTDSAVDNSFAYGTLNSGSAAPCLLSNLGSSFSLNVSATTPTAKNETIDSTLCSGQAFTLPNGTAVSISNSYRDTLRSVNGCDSVYRTVHLSIRAPGQQSLSASVCEGSGYSLPSGKMIFAAGVYKDTLYSASGCDSLITTVSLTLKSARTERYFASVCSGQSYTLPWGKVVSMAGIYSDTLKYSTGCDSLVREVNLQPVSPLKVIIDAIICEGDSLRLRWGPVVTKGGSYSDTLRTVGGCDSVIVTVGVAVWAKPTITLSKSNDINCTLGSARLTASGGNRYSWSPSTGLDRTDVADPLAAPAATTTYHVLATSAAGCTAEDSIPVMVSMVSSDNSFLMPNAFTPNGDGVNDCFGVRHWGAVSGLHFSIYDRWGKLVFYTEDPSQCWDGNNRGTQLPSGTYVYTIIAKTACGDVVRKGTVTMIR